MLKLCSPNEWEFKCNPKYPLLSIFVDVKNIKNDIYTFSDENGVWCLKTFCSLNMAQIPPSMYIDGIFFSFFIIYQVKSGSKSYSIPHFNKLHSFLSVAQVTCHSLLDLVVC